MFEGLDPVVNSYASAKRLSIVSWIDPNKEPSIRMVCDRFEYTDSRT